MELPVQLKKGGKVLKQGGHRAVLKQHQSIVVHVHTTKRTAKTKKGGYRAVKPIYQPQYAMQEPMFQHVMQQTNFRPTQGVPNSNISFAGMQLPNAVSEPTRSSTIPVRATESSSYEPNTPQKLLIPVPNIEPIFYNFNPDYTNFIRPYPFEHDFDRETEINQLPKQISTFYDHESKEPVDESSSSNQPEAGAIDLNTIIQRRGGLGINKVKEWIRNTTGTPVPSHITRTDDLNLWLFNEARNLNWDSIPKSKVGRKPNV